MEGRVISYAFRHSLPWSDAGPHLLLYDQYPFLEVLQSQQLLIH